MSLQHRLLIIGLDGATFDLIRPWAAAGKLPTIARLMETGASAPLRSVPNQNSAPAWSSYATGKNPGKHGIFYFDERIEGTYNKRYLNGGFRQGESWWMIASRHGKGTASDAGPSGGSRCAAAGTEFRRKGRSAAACHRSPLKASPKGSRLGRER